MRLIVVLVLGGLIGFGAALWLQGELPFDTSGSNHRADMELVLSDSYLTRQTGAAVAQRSGGSISRVRIRSNANDTLFVEARANAGVASVPVGVSLRPGVSNGGIRLSVRMAHLGPLPVPGVVVDPVLQVVDARIRDLVSSSGVRIVGVDTTNSGIAIYLKQ